MSMSETPSKRKVNGRFAVGIVVIALVLLAVFVAWRYWDVEQMIRAQAWLTKTRDDHWLMMCLMLVAIYAVVAGLSLPFSVPLTLAIAWLLGFWTALPVVSFGSTLGATLAFLFGRAFLRDWIRERMGTRAGHWIERFESDGARFLFTLRLIPAVPFSLINLGMGLTRIRPWTYWWVSQLGMLPATAVYVFAGASLPKLEDIAEGNVAKILDWRILLAFGLLAALPWTLKLLFRGWESDAGLNQKRNTEASRE
jgi:uncharacterized membrane protein YdjX (TVP38/TMEM64 family)